MLLMKEFERKNNNTTKHNIVFPTFKMPTSTKYLFMTDPLNLIVKTLIYDY